jgi:peptide-methionine (S)-S-oxide reductase
MAEEFATFAGGCFWCTEAVFDRLAGVNSVESGYIGGHVPNPSYREVCGGNTGHAEAIRIGFDPSVIGYDDLLDVFFATHDPTQLNRQGNDIGTQYRSAIFPHSNAPRPIGSGRSSLPSSPWRSGIRPRITIRNIGKAKGSGTPTASR